MFKVLNSKYIREHFFGENRINYIVRFPLVFFFFVMHIIVIACVYKSIFIALLLSENWFA